jgi:hypothetical protein
MNHDPPHKTIYLSQRYMGARSGSTQSYETARVFGGAKCKLRVSIFSRDSGRVYYAYAMHGRPCGWRWSRKGWPEGVWASKLTRSTDPDRYWRQLLRGKLERLAPPDPVRRVALVTTADEQAHFSNY